MARLQIRRYIWLIDIVRSAGPDGITYEEINRKWHRATLNEDGRDYAWRTFQEDRRIITGEFDIEITCDRRDNTYRIEELDEYGSVRGSLIDALVLNNAIRRLQISITASYSTTISTRNACPVLFVPSRNTGLSVSGT